MSSTDTTLDAWHLIQRQSADGAVEFQWKSWSRFTGSRQHRVRSRGRARTTWTT